MYMNTYLCNYYLFSVGRRGMEVLRVRATDPRPCPKCGKIYRSAHTLRTHLEDKHTVCPGYRCVLCGTVAKSRNSLHSHMSRQHRGISTKDLPVLQMPSPFDPELASRLFAKAGIKVSAAELRARASPTGPRRSEVRLELPRALSEAGSSICGGDDPEDLTLPLSLRYNSPTPNNNTVITKISGSSTSKPSTTATAIAAKTLDMIHTSREPNIASLHPSSHQTSHEASMISEHSALLETYLQLIAENSAFSSMNINQSQAAALAHVAKLHMNVENKHGSLISSPEDYPMIGRDEDGRNTALKDENRQDTMHDRQVDMETSGGEEEEFSEGEEPDIVKTE